MQQTILAIGALLIIMTTAMLYQRSSMLTHELAYIRQIEIAAEDAARMRLEGLSTLAYDESTVGATTTPTDLSILTPAASFGPEFTDVIPNDVDDYHGFTDTLLHVVSQDTFPFIIAYSVQYVDVITKNPTTSPTEAKELTANITSLTPIGSRQVNGVFSVLTVWSDNILTP